MVNYKSCMGCGACENACPVESIVLKDNEYGFLTPTINIEKCIDCGKCNIVCPMESEVADNNNISNYLFINSIEYDRALSSSGGFIKALSDYLFQNMPTKIYGAVFDDDFSIKHVSIDNKNDIYPLLGSKYVQSKIGKVFTEIEEDLESGYQVLFVGMPCQVAGLYKYLDKIDVSKLYTVNIFCHGVPSRKAWEIYLHEYHSEEEIRYIQFRYKYEGWWKHGLRIQYAHDDYYKPTRACLDPYMTAFLKDLTLNDTCFRCDYRKTRYVCGDFYIGDAWNINRIRTNMDDNKGITTVLCYSEKGKNIVTELSLNNTVFELDYAEIMKYRENIFEYRNVNEDRNRFMELLNKKGFRYAYEHI